MLLKALYGWRADNAAMEMGFPLEVLPREAKLETWTRAKAMDLSPKEAACYLGLISPDLILPYVVQFWIDDWTSKGRIRPGVLQETQGTQGTQGAIEGWGEIEGAYVAG